MTCSFEYWVILIFLKGLIWQGWAWTFSGTFYFLLVQAETPLIWGRNESNSFQLNLKKSGGRKKLLSQTSEQILMLNFDICTMQFIWAFSFLIDCNDGALFRPLKIMLIIHALHEISPCNTVSNEHLVAIYSFPNEAVYSWNISWWLSQRKVVIC